MTKAELRALPKNLTHVELLHYNFTDEQILFAYVPLKSEVDITPVIKEAKKLGLQVFIPSEDPLLFKSIDSDQYIDISKVKIPAVMFVPGLFFDHSGNRLGRGMGFYDKVLAHLSPSIHTVGLCKADRLLPCVPTESHDQKVHKVMAV